MMIKHQGEVVAVEFTPKYRPGSSSIQRTVAVMSDAMNKKEAVLKDEPEISFGGRTSLVMTQAGKMPVLTTPKAVVMMQDEQKGEVKLGIATSKWAMSAIKSNPSEAVAAAIVDAGKDQKEAMMTTLGKIIPETTQLELANMMSARGKKAAIDITMAKMASGTEPLRSVPSPVAKMLTDSTGKSSVTREKIAYQALGIKPPRASQIDSRFKTSLRKQITDILGVAGTVTSKSGKAHSLGQLPFIDNHIFLTPQHINDFRQMLSMYHLIRERNAPFMELLIPGFQKDDDNLIPLDKMIDYLMPSPDHMFRGERVMFFTTSETPGSADPEAAKFLKEFFKSHLLGLEVIEPPARTGQKNSQAARRLVRSFKSDTKKMFESVRIATSILVDSPLAIRFEEEKGILPLPKIASGSPALKKLKPVGKKKDPKFGRFESDYAVAGAYFEQGRKGHRIALSRFTFPYLGMGKRKNGEILSGPLKDKIVMQGVTGRPAHLLKGLIPQPRIKGPKGPTTGGSTKAGGQGPQKGAIGLIPLHNQGFTLPPIGWNRGWMIPVMQVMDEYWYMLGSSDTVKLEVHDLLYLIGNQAMESMGYEISAQEYLIILLLLGVFDSTGKSRETQTVELTLKQLEENDSAISQHIKALEKLKGKAVEVGEVTDFAKLTAEDEKMIAEAEAARMSMIMGAPTARPTARRRGAKRVPSILPFVKPSEQGSVGTKYWDKAKIKSLTKASQKEIESRIGRQLEPGDADVDTVMEVLNDSLADMRKQKEYLKSAEKVADKATSRIIGKYALDLAEMRKRFADLVTKAKETKAAAGVIKATLERTIQDDSNRMIGLIRGLNDKAGVPSIIKPLVDTVIQGMEDYGNLGFDTSKQIKDLKQILADGETKKSKAETVATLSKGKVVGFDALETIQKEASTRSPSLTLENLVNWIKKNKTNTKALTEQQKLAKKVVEGIEAGTYEEGAVQAAFVAGLGAILDAGKRATYFDTKGKIKGNGIKTVLGTVIKLPEAAEKKGLTGEAPLIAPTSGTEAADLLIALKEKEAELPSSSDTTTMRGTEEPATPSKFKTPPGWSQMIYDKYRKMDKQGRADYGLDLKTNDSIMHPAEIQDRTIGSFKGKGAENGEIIPPPSEYRPYISIRLEDGSILHFSPPEDGTNGIWVNGAEEEIPVSTKRKSAKRGERMYKGVAIRKLKNGYKVLMGSEDKQFKLLKQAKEYIDASKDKRRSSVLDGHTCVYMVGKSPCGGLLYTMKANPPMHKCRSCGAKYRLEGV